MQQGKGEKHDSGKARLSLLHFGFLEPIARVREWAVDGKYPDKCGWDVSVPNGKERYTDAMMRHLFACFNGHEISLDILDEESGLPSWNHVLCNMMFLDKKLRDEQKLKLAKAEEEPGGHQHEEIK